MDQITLLILSHFAFMLSFCLQIIANFLSLVYFLFPFFSHLYPIPFVISQTSFFLKTPLVLAKELEQALTSMDGLKLQTLMAYDLVQAASCMLVILLVLMKSTDLILAYFCNEFSKKDLIYFLLSIYKMGHCFRLLWMEDVELPL